MHPLSFSLTPTLLILLTIPSSLTTDPKLLSIELKPNFGAYYAELSLGNPPQTIYHGLDQGLTVTWTDVFKYSPSKSSTHQIIKQGDLKFQHLHLYGNEVKDSMHFPNNQTLPNFTFYTIKDSRGYNSRVGGFGLAHKFTDYKYSLVHQLHNEGLITKRSFAFVPPSSTNNGMFYIGGIPSNETHNKLISKCKVAGSYANWACKLSYIFMGDISYVYDNIYYHNDDYAFFQSAESRILVPHKFIQYLETHTLKQHLESGDCIKELYGMNQRFQCNCKVKETFPKMSFVFDSVAYTLTNEDLFVVDHGDVCNLGMVSNHIRKNNWIFGTKLIGKFISEFDFDEKEVRFYYDKEQEDTVYFVDLDVIFPWRKLLRISKYVVGVVLIIVCVGFIGLKIKNRKRRKMKKIAKHVEDGVAEELKPQEE